MMRMLNEKEINNFELAKAQKSRGLTLPFLFFVLTSIISIGIIIFLVWFIEKNAFIPMFITEGKGYFVNLNLLLLLIFFIIFVFSTGIALSDFYKRKDDASTESDYLNQAYNYIASQYFNENSKVRVLEKEKKELGNEIAELKKKLKEYGPSEKPEVPDNGGK